ncbi:MAG: sugar phosphate nucleotidyltransferase [Steroidobacteraceae bacterium]
MSDSHRSDHLYALILAGGDGNRLKSLTTTAEGIAVPKQYCSLHGEVTLLDKALSRAAALVDTQHIYTVVAAHHQQWWKNLLEDYSPEQIIVQPKNCGTAIGIMLPLLHILQRDPDAHIVLLPSDHHVQEEEILTQSLLSAAQLLDHGAEQLLILGMEPDEADTELGYVLPGRRLNAGLATVTSFIEKPPAMRAQLLVGQGALWNTFIVATRGTTLMKIFAQRCQNLLEEMQSIVSNAQEKRRYRTLLDELYTRLPALDFSRDILQGLESMLGVLKVPFCGWSDLGTPRRIREVLHRWPRSSEIVAHSSHLPLSVNLAAHASFILSKSLTGTPFPQAREA